MSTTPTTSILGTSLSLIRILLHRPAPDLLEVTHHGLKPPLLLAELTFQLLHDLYLHLCLRRAPIIQHVTPVIRATVNHRVLVLVVSLTW